MTQSVLSEINLADKSPTGKVADSQVVSIIRKAITRRVSIVPRWFLSPNILEVTDAHEDGLCIAIYRCFTDRTRRGRKQGSKLSLNFPPSYHAGGRSRCAAAEDLDRTKGDIGLKARYGRRLEIFLLSGRQITRRRPARETES